MLSEHFLLSHIIEIALTSVVLQQVIQTEDVILGVKALESVIPGAGCAN